MIEYKSDLTVIKRLVENSESKLFPRMKKRKDYLDALVKDNEQVPPALKAEVEINELVRQHIQLVMNYAIYMEKFIENNLINEQISQSDYEKVLEQELLYEFRKRNNIVK